MKTAFITIHEQKGRAFGCGLFICGGNTGQYRALVE